jgi:hypothetical protein
MMCCVFTGQQQVGGGGGCILWKNHPFMNKLINTC